MSYFMQNQVCFFLVNVCTAGTPERSTQMSGSISGSGLTLELAHLGAWERVGREEVLRTGPPPHPATTGANRGNLGSK